VLVRSLGSAPGIAAALAALVVQTAVPLWIALRVFRRRDW
jgi:hypothetical protein